MPALRPPAGVEVECLPLLRYGGAPTAGLERLRGRDVRALTTRSAHIIGIETASRGAVSLYENGQDVAGWKSSSVSEIAPASRIS
jgi:hypothetical protein